MAAGWDDPALARPRRPGYNDECDSAMASAQASGIRPPRKARSTERPRNSARLDRLVETHRLLETLRRLGYGPSWVAERPCDRHKLVARTQGAAAGNASKAAGSAAGSAP